MRITTNKLVIIVLWRKLFYLKKKYITILFIGQDSQLLEDSQVFQNKILDYLDKYLRSRIPLKEISLEFKTLLFVWFGF